MTDAARAAPTGELSFATVLEHRAALERQLAAGALTLDLSGVTYADSAGLSLLLDLTRAARAANHELRIGGVPAGLQRLIDFFELRDMLPLSA